MLWKSSRCSSVLNLSSWSINQIQWMNTRMNKCMDVRQSAVGGKENNVGLPAATLDIVAKPLEMIQLRFL